MTEPAGQAEGRFPGLLEGGRRLALAQLVGLALCEALGHVAVAAALKALLLDVVDGAAAAAWLTLTAAAVLGLFWARSVFAEAFGLGYANDVRHGLAAQAIRAAGGRGRLGTIAIRMTGDLHALSLWADRGICGGVTAVATLGGALGAAWVAIGPHGLPAVLAGPVVAILLMALIARPLETAIRRRRAARGLLSAWSGDLVLGAPAAAAYSAEARFAGKIRTAGRQTVAAGVAEARFTALARGAALLALPVGASVLAASPQAVDAVLAGPAAWAGALFALSLAACSVRNLAGAFIAGLERRVAMRKLLQLTDQAYDAPAAAPSGEERLPPGPGLALSIDGEPVAEPGGFAAIARDQAEAWIARLRCGGAGVQVDGMEASEISPTDWARRVAYCGPGLPLPRGRLREILSAKRLAEEKAVRPALKLVGLKPEDDVLQGMIDPQKHPAGEALMSRLRLARALTHRPRLLVIDDPWISGELALSASLARWASDRGVTLVVIDADQAATSQKTDSEKPAAAKRPAVH
jgi:ABC-type multidrug transport system fused ATPase/permease subunit